MAFVLSCTLSHRIAAVGLIGSAQTLSWRWCTDTRPVPMIAIHGTADTAAPYDGGASWVATEILPSIPVWAAKWARRNQCAPRPVETAVARDVVLREYTHCADNATVALYAVRGAGHTWPGGGPLPEWFVGPTSNSIDGAQTLWAFYREHPLARR
jgi:polyhydroxybutyrate depolymerase